MEKEKTVGWAGKDKKNRRRGRVAVYFKVHSFSYSSPGDGNRYSHHYLYYYYSIR